MVTGEPDIKRNGGAASSAASVQEQRVQGMLAEARTGVMLNRAPKDAGPIRIVVADDAIRVE